MGKHQFKASDSAVLPAKVILETISSTEVNVQIEDRKTKDDATCTKYRIEWSTTENFDQRSTSHMEISHKLNSSLVVGDLRPGAKYYFRVATGNCKGYANQYSASMSIIPSHWCDYDPYNKPSRYDGRSLILDKVVAQWMTNNSKYTPIFSSQYHEETSIVGSDFQPKKKSSIMHRLTTFPKFEKNISSGSFLACVVYTESKVLMTVGDILPIIRIDEDFPTTVQSDFNWFLKVACKWDDVKTLKLALEKSDAASSFDFRLKLLHAAESMQDALGEKDLGTLYHKIIRNANNSTIIFSTVFQARTTKRLPLFNFRWVSLAKRSIKPSNSNNIQSLLHNSIEDQIFYDRMNTVPLEKGLYLGYLKLASSMNLLQVFVPKKTPNMFPCTKIRNNPHVTGEEWLLIQKLPISRLLDTKSLKSYGRNEQQACPPKKEAAYSSDVQELFQQDINKALQRLFLELKIEYEESLVHRMYRSEIVQISPQVSMLLVFPSFDNLCLRFGDCDALFTKSEFICLPIQVFEINFLRTYQKDFIQRHARLSTILEIEFFLAKQSLREALTFAEIKLSEKKIAILTELKEDIESNWRDSRWVFDLITSARSKDSLNNTLKKIKSLKYKTIGHNGSGNYGSLKSPPKVKEDLKTYPVKSKTPELPPKNKQIITNQNHDIIIPKVTKPDFWNSSSNISSSSLQCDSTDHRSYFTRSMDARTNMIYLSSPNIIHSQSDPTRSIHFTYSESHHKKDRHENLRLNNTWTETSTYKKSSNEFQPRKLSPVNTLNSLNTETKQIKVMQIDDSHQPHWFDINEQSCSKFPVVPDLTECQSGVSEVGKQQMEITCTKIVQIYAAYDCGLAEGTFVRLQINNKTTVKEVVQRLIHELNVAAKHKGFPRPYESIHDFCLVSVIGARERVLRMDFQLLLLQKPWSMARLYVRKKNEVTAAIIADSVL